MQVLRDYQLKAKLDLRARLREGKRKPLLVAPTGAGKTTIAAALIESATRKGASIIFCAHRKELISQCSKRLDGVGVDHGIIRGSDHSRRRPFLPVQVASVPTLAKRESLPKADILIIDECHRAKAATYMKVIERYPGAILLGLTATPVRLDGSGLGDLFDCMVECPSIGALTEQGYLVPFRIFAPHRPNLKGVHTVAGDYKADELAAAVDKPKIVGDLVRTWKQYAPDRITLCFAVNIEHSKHIAEEFRAAGIPAEHVDGEMSDHERDAILTRLEAGMTRVVTNVDVFCEGTDIPIVSCIINARPTQSLRIALQQWGRGARLHPESGKRDCIVLDHAGLVQLHGFPDDERVWTLDAPARRKSAKRPELSVRMCLKCWRAFRSTEDKCPECGWLYVGRKREIRNVDGELQEVSRSRTPEEWRQIPEEKRRAHYRQLVATASEKNYKKGWILVTFKRLYGHFPPKRWAEPDTQAVTA